jgi:chaperone modulatory protein CbpM
MIISKLDFLYRAELDQETLEVWMAEEWLVPSEAVPEPVFSELDLARAKLIRELKSDFGVNDEGVSIILRLLDQMQHAKGDGRHLPRKVHCLNCLGGRFLRPCSGCQAHATLRRNRRWSSGTRTVDPMMLARPASTNGWSRSRLSSNTEPSNPYRPAICPKSAVKLHMICSMIAARILSSAMVASPRVTGDFPSLMASLQASVSRAA